MLFSSFELELRCKVVQCSYFEHIARLKLSFPVSNLIVMCLFKKNKNKNLFVLNCKPCHIPLQYRCPVRESDYFSYVSLNLQRLVKSAFMLGWGQMYQDTSSSLGLCVKGRGGSVFKIEALIWVSFRRALKFQLFSWRARSNPRRQAKNMEMKCKPPIKLVRELHGTCFLYNVKNYESTI